jgi:hypothetical protein
MNNTVVENKKLIDEIAAKIYNMPCWAALVLFLAIVVIIMWGASFFYKLNAGNVEGFEQESRFILKKQRFYSQT